MQCHQLISSRKFSFRALIWCFSEDSMNEMGCDVCSVVFSSSKRISLSLFHWVMVNGTKDLSCPHQHGAHGAVEGDRVWDSYGTHGIFQVAFFWVWRDWVHFKNEALKTTSFRLSDSCISLCLTVSFSGVQASSSVNALTVYVYARIYSVYIILNAWYEKICVRYPFALSHLPSLGLINIFIFPLY